MKNFKKLFGVMLVIAALSCNYAFSQSFLDILEFAETEFENPIIFVPIKDNPVFEYSTLGASFDITTEEVEKIKRAGNVSFFRHQNENTLEYFVFTNNQDDYDPICMIVEIPNGEIEGAVAFWLFNFMNWAENVGGCGLDPINIQKLLENDEETWELFSKRVQIDPKVLEYAKKLKATRMYRVL